MHCHKAAYAWLSSYDTNIFFYREIGSKLLYISKQYDLEEMRPLHLYSWFLRARGFINEEMVFPKPDYELFNHLMKRAIINPGLLSWYVVI